MEQLGSREHLPLMLTLSTRRVCRWLSAAASPAPPSHSPQVLLDQLLLREQLLWERHCRHLELVLHRAGLPSLEGSLAYEDGLPVLDGLDRAHREAPPRAGALHLVQNWHGGVPWKAEEPAVSPQLSQ